MLSSPFLHVLVACLTVVACQPTSTPPATGASDDSADFTQEIAIATVSGAKHFEALHRQWHRERRSIRYSSRTSDYLELPAFRAIVDLGPAAIPHLYRVLESDGGSFFLAFAVAEICSWPFESLYRGRGDQSVRIGVLENLESDVPCTAE